MKKYTKPQIMFESFVASTNIAGNCEVIFDLQGRNTCGFPGSVAGYVIFDIGPGNTSNCTYPGSSEDKYNGLCYHVPDAARNLFNS
ncbi:MAG: hypothetical protein E7455_09105 [Ruminococcaceae bacterium]|nr:hypothetical protein [Oscillospiraceae bacterium]